MPIKGRSDVVRIPRIGKIHLGVKQTSAKSGHAYPTAVDFFVVKADDSTSETAAAAFRSVYGEQPREITVCFPSNDPERFFPQYLSSYRGGNGRYELFCRGDGERAQRADGQGGRIEIPCTYRDCPIYQDGKCKELGQLQFFLPDVPGVGVWQLDSSSYHTTVNLNGSIQMVQALTGGRIAMIPLKLRIVPKVVNPDGKPKTVYVLTLGIDDMKLTDFLMNTPLLTAGSPVVEPIPENELPDDLYIDSNLVHEGSESKESSEVIEGNIGAVCEVEIRPHKDHEAARIRLASVDGEMVELFATEAPIVNKLKRIQEGNAIAYRATPSQTWPGRLEIEDFRVVS